MGLAEQQCEACRTGAPRVSDEEQKELMLSIPNWSVKVREGVRQLERKFQFQNFADALVFANKVGDLAEAEHHHPSILVEWGKVTVTWWTHKIQGLHRNDFIMAARTDQL